MAIHDAGVVHNDIHPANILARDGKPVIIDFEHAEERVCKRDEDTIVRNAPAPTILDVNCDELFYLCANLDIWEPGMSILDLQVFYTATYILKIFSKSA
jgi:serine/threonine protein kinase